MAIPIYSKADKAPLRKLMFGLFEKVRTTPVARIDGPFSVKTRHEGIVTCMDGYLALDSEGHPYPIAWSEFKKIYQGGTEKLSGITFFPPEK
jgi:hypothetical protein